MRLVFCALTFVVVLGGCSNPAEELVRREMIDPDSAQFEEISTCPGDSSLTTGRVNGKNRMGAYTGFTAFFVEGDTVHFAGEDSSTNFLQLIDRCYDTGRTADAAADAGISSPDSGDSSGNWIVSTDRDPIDDSAVIVASLNAESGQGRLGGTVSIVARCASNTTEFYADWVNYLGDDSRSVYDEYKNVEVRVGDNPAASERWSISTDKQATFAPAAVPLLKRMANSDRLVLRTTPYNESPVTAVFDLTGIEEAIRPLAEECSWEL